MKEKVSTGMLGDEGHVKTETDVEFYFHRTKNTWF